MGKEGELWDDSVLVKAFDDAMSKYKKMHSKNRSNDSSVEGQTVTSNVSARDHEAIRLTEAEDNSIVSKTETEMTEAKNLNPVEENTCDSHATEPHVNSSNDLSTQDAPKGYTYSQCPEDYNQLLGQFYELEEKRQLVLQQLHQFGTWNYQFSGESFSSGAQWGSCSTSQEHPLPPSQTSHPAVVCSCCPYASQCLLPPCTTYSACSFGAACNGKTCNITNADMKSGKSPSVVDGDIVKKAMGAVEKAISSMKTNEETQKEGEIVQSISPETDLTDVLNAWYSAGFYTGRYLTEQSIARNRRN